MMKRIRLILQILSDIIVVIIVVVGLSEKDPKCRYRIHLPQASWHTAYDVCHKNNMTLARIERSAELHFLAEVLEEVKIMNKYSIKSIYSDVWIGAIMRTSNNESMHLDCKSFYSYPQINIPKTKLKDEMTCLYFNLTDRKLYVDNCERNKTFVCENKNQAPLYCMMVSNTQSLRNDSQYPLAFNQVPKGCGSPSVCDDNQNICTLACIKDAECYAVIWTGHHCTAVRYLSSSNDIQFVKNISTIRHKSYFVFSKDSYPASKPKPLSKWCPEMTQEILQEKIDAIQTNLTINRKNTTKYMRTLISAPDDRTSARNLGLVGVIIICLVASVIVSFDFINVFQNVSRSRSGIKEE